MLAKPLAAIYDNIREICTAVEDGRLVGVGGLHILWCDLAEVRSLAVRSDCQHRGVGAEIVLQIRTRGQRIRGRANLCFDLSKEIFSKMWFSCYRT